MPATATRRRSRHPFAEVDLLACTCVDVGHHWRVVELRPGQRSRVLAGVPERQMLCMTCSTLQLQSVAWDGSVVARWYECDELFLTNARQLGDTVAERRRNYRAEQLRREKNGALANAED